MTHPTQPVPKSSTWEQAQGTMLHLANCIVVIEIWKPIVRPRFSFAQFATVFPGFAHSLTCMLSIFCSFMLRGSRGHSGVVDGFKSPLNIMNYSLKNVILKYTIMLKNGSLKSCSCISL